MQFCGLKNLSSRNLESLGHSAPATKNCEEFSGSENISSYSEIFQLHHPPPPIHHRFATALTTLCNVTCRNVCKQNMITLAKLKIYSLHDINSNILFMLRFTFKFFLLNEPLLFNFFYKNGYFCIRTLIFLYVYKKKALHERCWSAPGALQLYIPAI